MKKTMVIFIMLIMTSFVVEGAIAASGKCTVVNVDGERMVLECNKETKGFAKGTQIKIKSEKPKTVQGK